MGFRNVSFFGEISENKQIRENLIWFFREQLLNIGAYYNFKDDVSLPYNSNIDSNILYPSYQPGLGNFQFWKGHSHQWVWESGINYTYANPTAPITISGVYVNNTYIPSNSAGSYAHYVDYNRGGIVFSNPLSSGLDIRCNHSERSAFIYDSDSNELRELNLQHLRLFDSYNNPGSGFDIKSPDLKVFLPAIFIDVQYDYGVPYELGSAAQFKNYKVIFDIVSDNSPTYHLLKDICTNLQTVCIQMFDANAVLATGDYPLDYLGKLTSDAKVRSELVSLYPWKKGVFLENFKQIDVLNILPIRRGRIFADFQIVI